LARQFETLLTVCDVQRRAARAGLQITTDAIRAAERRGDLSAFRTPSGIRLFSEREADRFIVKRIRATATPTDDAA
jgi:hypothetical protein